MDNVRQNTFEIEMKGKTDTILLAFPKKEMLESAVKLKDFKVSKGNNNFTVYYGLELGSVSGANKVKFPCKCKGEHPTEFVPVDDQNNQTHQGERA